MHCPTVSWLIIPLASNPHSRLQVTRAAHCSDHDTAQCKVQLADTRTCTRTGVDMHSARWRSPHAVVIRIRRASVTFDEFEDSRVCVCNQACSPRWTYRAGNRGQAPSLLWGRTRTGDVLPRVEISIERLRTGRRDVESKPPSVFAA